MTTTLAISASGGPAHCVLETTDGTRIAGTTPDLVGAIAEVTGRATCSPRDIDEVRLDIGPGSYTGLRTAITFARTFASQRTRTQSPVAIRTATSFELLATTLPDCERTLLVLDARRQRVHAAQCSILANEIALLSEPRAVPLEEFPSLVGGGDTVYAEPSCLEPIAELAGSGTQVNPLDRPSSGLSEVLLDRRVRLVAAEVEALEPLYLMGSYAE